MKPKLHGFVNDGILAIIGCQRLSGMEGECVVLEELYKKGRVYTFFWKIGGERDTGSAFCRIV